MDTIEVAIVLAEAEHEPLIALLAEDATGFVQRDDRLTAYVPADRWSAALRQAIEREVQALGHPATVEARRTPERNWNAEWERSMQPTRVGPFLVTPTWADVPPEHAEAVVLTIDPKMSFGTGYHKSTRLALRLLPDVDVAGTRVLDVGTGTGILAIAACRLGAASVVAVDVDGWAYANARENVALNEVAGCVDVRRGSLEAVPERDFDVVCANINREVLLDLMPSFAEKLAPGGFLILSGLLRSDRPRLIAERE